MKKFITQTLLFLAVVFNFIACTETPEYEDVAVKYQEARYRGDIVEQKALSTPESDSVIDLFEAIYTQYPHLKDINAEASCSVTKSELSEDGKYAYVTIEENNVHTGNLLSLNTSKVVDTQETVIELKKSNNKWLVIVKY